VLTRGEILLVESTPSNNGDFLATYVRGGIMRSIAHTARDIMLMEV